MEHQKTMGWGEYPTMKLCTITKFAKRLMFSEFQESNKGAETKTDIQSPWLF